MTTVVTEPRTVTVPGSSLTDDSLAALRQLPAEMLRQVTAARSKRELLLALAKLLPRYQLPLAVLYLERNAQGHLTDPTRLYPVAIDESTERLTQHLPAACQAACSQGALEIRRLAAPARVIIASPVVLQGRDPEAIGFVFEAQLPVQSLTWLAQIYASHIVLWHVLQAGIDSDQDARVTASLVELLANVGSAPDLRSACYTLAAELQSHLHVRRVVVGLRPRGKGHCRLRVISGVAQFDPRSQTAGAMEAALDEVVLRDEMVVWPAVSESARHGTLAHKQLCSLEGVQSVISIPLRDGEGSAIGALMLLDGATEKSLQLQRFLSAAERPLASALKIAVRLQGGPLARLARIIGVVWRTWRFRLALAAIVALAIVMACPCTYRLHCDCQIEPVTRRFIAAPFEGTLERSLVKPGDLVAVGDLLAQMDGREIRWKRASVEADRSQAIKKRDSAQAIHNYAEMQIAALEIERLDLELRLLDDRAAHLDIRSQLAGIVVTGNLERAEGAPLVVGQTLFEIAPLQDMIVEIAIPDADVSFAREGQPIAVELDALPHQTWQTSLLKVNPRAEIRDDRNVFVAEATLDNCAGQFSPGMKGRATVETVRKPLIWILFHKPWEYLVKTLCW